MRMLLAAAAFLAMSPLAMVKAQDCANASSQSAMNICADQDYKKTDAELNSVYKHIAARLKTDRDTTRLLVNAQKTWIAFRDAECTFSTSGSAEGSINPMLVAQCRDGITQRRIIDLKRYLHCQEGDMGCPVPSSQAASHADLTPSANGAKAEHDSRSSSSASGIGPPTYAHDQKP
jgi:uncharacterized protein YecT (DUF1311 family)